MSYHEALCSHERDRQIRSLPSSLCIFAFTDIIVSKGDTLSSNAAPVSVSMYSSIAPNCPLHLQKRQHRFQSISLWPYTSKQKQRNKDTVFKELEPFLARQYQYSLKSITIFSKSHLQIFEKLLFIKKILNIFSTTHGKTIE